MPEERPPYFVKCPGASQDFDQDALYLIPYLVGQIRPGLVPSYGMTFNDVYLESQMQIPIADQLADYILINIEENSISEKFLVFARKVEPAGDLPPSNTYFTNKWESWPPVLRYCNVAHIIDGGNYLGTQVDEFHVDETRELCIVQVDEWWTTSPWPASLIGGVNVLTGWVKTPPYPLPDKFSLNCLHDDIEFPSLSGITKINGQTAHPQVVRAVKYSATSPKTWIPVIDEDSQQVEDGRYHRIRHIVYPPFNPLIYPEAPIIIGT